MPLLTIEEWNSRAFERAEEERGEKWRPCLIACPECGTELEMNMWVLLTSYPGQRYVRCPSEGCEYTGTVFE